MPQIRGNTAQLYSIDQLFPLNPHDIHTHRAGYQERLVLPLYRLIHTVDPAEVFFSFDAHLIKQVFSTLVEVDEQTGEAKPMVAHHWQRNEAGTEWTFYLRKGVHFHHGRELTAEDVRFTFDRLKESTSTQQWLVKGIAHIEILNRYMVRFHLHEPNYLFLDFLGFPPASIVPQDVYERPSSQPMLPVGSGPFQMIERVEGRCVLQAYESYFLGRAYIDRVEIIVVPEIDATYLVEAESNLLLVRTGEAELDHMEHRREEYELCGCSMISLNLRKAGPLQDLRFRQALFQLVDRDRLVHELGEPRIAPALAFRLPGAYEHVRTVDRKRGLQQLRSSTYAGERLQLYTFARHEPDARWLQDFYAAYGINLDVHIVPWTDLLRREIKGKADMLMFEAVLSEGIIRLIETYQSENSLMLSQWGDDLAQFTSEGVRKLLGEPTAEKREEQLARMEERFDEAYALLYLSYKSVVVTSHPSLKGVAVNQRGWVDFKDVWFATSY